MGTRSAQNITEMPGHTGFFKKKKNKPHSPSDENAMLLARNIVGLEPVQDPPLRMECSSKHLTTSCLMNVEICISCEDGTQESLAKWFPRSGLLCTFRWVGAEVPGPAHPRPVSPR